MEVSLTINGELKTFKTFPTETLLALLRRQGYKSLKFGCGEGACGACTIILDGRPVNSCLVLSGLAAGKKIETLEGLGDQKQPHMLQEAFMETGAVQCGFCTPGMILSTKSLLDKNSNPSDSEIRDALDGNLCRCTGYEQIFDAVKLAAKKLRTAKRKQRSKI